VDLGDDLGNAVRMRQDAADDQDEVGRDEDEEERKKGSDGFLQSTDVEDRERDDDDDLERELEGLVAEGQVREDRFAPAGNGDRDRQDVVDREGRAGDDACRAAEELARHRVAAAAVRELLDDLAVGVGDDDDRERGREREEDGEVRVLAERAERLVGSVGGGRQAVGAQTDPGEESAQRELVDEPGIAQRVRRPEQGALDASTETLLWRGGIASRAAPGRSP
jgi:hypothetical protein